MSQKENKLSWAEEKLLDTGRDYYTDVDEINGDIIGKLCSAEFLDNWRAASEAGHNGQKDMLHEIILKCIDDQKMAGRISAAVTSYGDSMRTLGFREGINIALNFMVQGMRFPTLND